MNFELPSFISPDHMTPAVALAAMIWWMWLQYRKMRKEDAEDDQRLDAQGKLHQAEGQIRDDLMELNRNLLSRADELSSKLRDTSMENGELRGKLAREQEDNARLRGLIQQSLQRCVHAQKCWGASPP